MNCSPTLEQLSRLRVGVLGYGREGKSAVRALVARYPDMDLTVLVESGDVPTDLPVIEGRFDDRLGSFDVLLRSPGVPLDHPALVAYRDNGGRIINPSSIWFAERAQVRVVGVTGSKGKSTTASLLAHLLESVGKKVLLAGNIGVPLLDHLDTDADLVVVELSSYQLADLEGNLSLGLITRLFSEHVDWHGTCDQYFEAKLRIADLLHGRPLLVNAGDDRLVRATEHVPGRIKANSPPGVHRSDDDLLLDSRRLVRGSDLGLIGRHNLDNAALAVQACLMLGLDAELLAAALKTFRPLPHRLEPVESNDDLRWINDSIATSPYATLAALEALKPVPVTLIAGGKDRPAEWQPVIDWCIDNGLQALVAIPDNGPAIAGRFRSQAASSVQHIHQASGIEEAVSIARQLSPAGSVVLLSPGAPSFPHFRDFEDRGEQFRRAVTNSLAQPGD